MASPVGSAAEARRHSELTLQSRDGDVPDENPIWVKLPLISIPSSFTTKHEQERFGNDDAQA